MKKYINIALCAFLSALIGISCNTRAQNSETQLSKKDNETPKVYMFKEISPENLVKIYEALNRKATGKVAVKLSTGEPGGHNFLQPALIKDLVQKVNGTIVECNTAYGGGRADTESHLKAAADHGFTAIAPVDIMDSEGETALPVHGGKHLKENYVGAHYPNYHNPLSFQRPCYGRIRRSNKKHVHRHRFIYRKSMDTFCRENQREPVGKPACTRRFLGIDGRSRQIGG